jgi:putative transposase
LIRENKAIIVESLNIRGMVRNRSITRSIADAAWSSFLRMLQYKTEWYGVTLIAVGQFMPTSKRCHKCGFIYELLTLAEREWTCASCGTTHDRDLNAAKNIKLMGLESIKTPREPRAEPVERSAKVDALKQETPPSRVG